MDQSNRNAPEFIQQVEELSKAWESSLGTNYLLSRERKQTYGYAVRQFIKWLKDGQGARLPRQS